MISIVLSKSVDKSNTKYYDVVIKWLKLCSMLFLFDLLLMIAAKCIIYIL